MMAIYYLVRFPPVALFAEIYADLQSLDFVFIGILLAILLRGNWLKHDPYKPVKTGLLF
jgi:hypothetical protein